VLPVPEKGGVLHQLLTDDPPADVFLPTLPPNDAARSAALVHTVSTVECQTVNSMIKLYYYMAEPAMTDLSSKRLDTSHHGLT